MAGGLVTVRHPTPTLDVRRPEASTTILAKFVLKCTSISPFLSFNFLQNTSATKQKEQQQQLDSINKPQLSGPETS